LTRILRFTGLVGFSIALNGGVARPKPIADASVDAGATVDLSSAIPAWCLQIS